MLCQQTMESIFKMMCLPRCYPTKPWRCGTKPFWEMIQSHSHDSLLDSILRSILKWMAAQSSDLSPSNFRMGWQDGMNGSWPWSSVSALSSSSPSNKPSLSTVRLLRVPRPGHLLGLQTGHPDGTVFRLSFLRHLQASLVCAMRFLQLPRPSHLPTIVWWVR